MVVENEFELGQIVYLKTDSDQEQRIVTGVVVRPTGMGYYVTHGVEESSHYSFELSATRDETKALGIPTWDQ